MKARIEAAANVIVVIVAIVVGSVFLKDRFSTPPSETNIVKAGDKLGNLDGWDWGAHDESLVMVLRKGCHFCEDSAPFYQRLITQRRGASKTAILAVFPDTADTVREVAQSEGLGVHTVAGVPLQTLKVSGTPTLLLVDKTGTVLNVWTGMLSPRQELEVVKASNGNG